VKFIWAIFGLIFSTAVYGTPSTGTTIRSALDSLLTTSIQMDNPSGFKALLKDHLQFKAADTVDPVFRGLYCMALDRNNDALKAFGEALGDEIGNPEIRSKLFYIRSQCQVYLGDLKASIVDLDSAISLEPMWPEAWSNRSVLLTTLGRAEEGLASSETALSLNGKSCKAWNNRGFALDRLKREQEATSCFDSALAYCPDFDEALFNRGISSLAQEDYKAADDFFSRCLKSNPVYVPALSMKSKTLILLGEPADSAIVYLDACIALGYRSVESWSTRGILLGIMKRYRDASASFDSGLALDPNNYWLKGQKVKAAYHLRDSVGR
jgi:tetratricopeptide (TPR) repeat protein